MVADAERRAGAEIYGWARAIYDAELRHLEAEHTGEFLVLDVNTGEYEVDAERGQAALRMLARFPDEDAQAFCAFRVGAPPSYRRGLVKGADGSEDTDGWQQADAIYEAQFRPREPELKGKFLVLDVNTGDYEIDEKHVQAALRMLERHPVESERAFYSYRIGYPATYHFGGWPAWFKE